MAILKNFGIYAAIGVMLEFFVAAVVCIYILGRLEQKRLKQGLGPAGAPAAFPSSSLRQGVLHGLLGWINAFNQKKYKGVVVCAALVLATSIYFTAQIKVDTYSIDFLLDSNPVKQDAKFFEKDYGYYLPLEVRLQPKSAQGVKDPVFLRKLSVLQAQLERDPQIAKTTSLADIIKQLHWSLNEKRARDYQIPPTREAVAQELMLYEMDPQSNLESFVDKDYRELRLTLRIPMRSSKTFDAIIQRVTAQVQRVYGDSVKLIYGGYIPLYIKLLDYVAESQISSFLVAFLLIFLSTGLLFRSGYFFVITVIPNVIPVMITLGIMGLAQINLDVATVTIAALTIGLSVDNTIQYLYTYRQKLRDGVPRRLAIEETLLSTGKPMFISNIILVLGYFIMLFSSIKSVIYFGLLIGSTMFFAVLCDLFLLPSLLLLWSPKRVGPQ
jgi:predicted RND superfamily exporter protein